MRVYLERAKTKVEDIFFSNGLENKSWNSAKNVTINMLIGTREIGMDYSDAVHYRDDMGVAQAEKTKDAAGDNGVGVAASSPHQRSQRSKKHVSIHKQC